MEYKEKINETLKVFSEDDVHELQDDSMNSLTWPYDDEQEALDKMVQDLEDSGENDSHSDDNTIQEIDDSMGELDEQEDETLMTSSKDDSHSHTMEELTGKYKAPQTLEVGSNSLQYDDNTDDEQEVLDRMVQDLKTSGEDYSHSDDNTFEEQDEQKDDPMGELDEQDNLKTLMTSSKDDCHSLVMEKLTGKHKPPHSLAAGTNSLPCDDKTVNEQEILDKMVENLKASGEDDSYSDDDSIEEQDEKKDDSMGELDEQEHLKTLKTCSKGDFHSCSKQELTGKYKPPQTLEVGTNSLSYDDNTVDEQETLDNMVQDLKGSGEDVGISLTVDDMLETLDGKIIPRKVAEEMLKKMLKADKNMKKETHHLSHPNLIPDSPKADKIIDPLSQIVSPDHSWTTMLTHTRDHVKTSTDQEYLTSSTSSEHLVLTATVKPDTEKVSEKIKENKFKYPALQRYKGFGNKLKKRKYPGFGGKLKKNKKLIPKVKGLETKKTYRISQAFSEATATKTDELNLISEDEVISEVLPRNDLISQIDGGGQELADNGSHMTDFEVQKTKEERPVRACREKNDICENPKDQNNMTSKLKIFFNVNKIKFEPRSLTKADGNCWFHAIVDQLQLHQVPNKPTTHKQLRIEVSNFLNHLPDSIAQDMIDIIFKGKRQGLSRLAYRQKKPGQFVDDNGIMVIATGLFLGRWIHVHREDLDGRHRVITFDGGEGSQNFAPLNVFYFKDYQHYQ